MSSAALVIRAVPGIPEIEPHCDLAARLLEALEAAAIELADGDVLVVAQKIVSKAEGRYLHLAEVAPSPRAVELGQRTNKDPRFVEAVLSESTEVLRAARNVLITRHRLGHVMANAGIDRSNLPQLAGEERVLLLPLDPDRSARGLRDALAHARQVSVAVVISDSFGRPWRLGQSEVAIGLAGVIAIDDWRGREDAHGRELAATVIATADQLAGAADLARAKDSGRPAVLIRGAGHLWTADDGDGAAAVIQRPPDADLFR